MERLYGLVFAAKRMVKGAATLTSFALTRRGSDFFEKKSVKKLLRGLFEKAPLSSAFYSAAWRGA